MLCHKILNKPHKMQTYKIFSKNWTFVFLGFYIYHDYFYHTHTYIYTPTLTHLHTPTHTHTPTNTRTYTHTHLHTHAPLHTHLPVSKNYNYNEQSTDSFNFFFQVSNAFYKKQAKWQPLLTLHKLFCGSLIYLYIYTQMYMYMHKYIYIESNFCNTYVFWTSKL